VESYKTRVIPETFPPPNYPFPGMLANQPIALKNHYFSMTGTNIAIYKALTSKEPVMAYRQNLPGLFLAILMFGLVGPVWSEAKVVAPDTIPGTTKVDAEGVLDIVQNNPDILIIDARMRKDRVQGYMEGSISLPDVETTCESLAKFIPRKTSPLLFYCNGPKCGRSGKSSRKALACGYTHVYWFRGGFEEWKQKDYPYLKE
jgi:rhodanese-related sulfurtransferase